MASVKALVMDWGGVLTAPLEATMPDWARAERIDLGHFRDVMRGWVDLSQQARGPSPTHLLERGELAPADFEVLLADELERRGSFTRPEGLLGRMLAGLVELDATMMGLVRSARHAGIRTALLSNSWGEHYPEELWDDLFDVVVISGRVGMRKPEAQIYAHTVEALGVPAGACVMVDDMPRNVEGATAAGMQVVHHTAVDDTLRRVRSLLGFADDLAGAAQADVEDGPSTDRVGMTS